MPGKPSRPEKPVHEEPRGSSWGFGGEGEYAVDKTERIQWVAALCVVALWVVLAFLKAGLGISIRVFAGFIIPLAAIRWPDAISRLRMPRGGFQPEGWPRAGDRWVRAAAWVWLLYPVWLWLLGIVLKKSAE